MQSKKTLLATQELEKQKRLSRNVQLMLDEYELGEKDGSRHGTFLILQEASKLLEKGKDILFCGESVMSTVAPNEVVKKSKELFELAATKEVAPFNGLAELRNAISGRFERLYGQRVDPESQVVVTSGSLEAEYDTVAAILNPGDEAIMPVPNFFFDVPIKLVGGKPVFYQLFAKDNYYHDAHKIEKLVTKRTKLIVVCNPHNPTGRVLTKEELKGIAEIAEKYNLFILHDQVYERMVFDQRPYVSMAEFKNVRDRLITASSFSKLFNMINYRLGYAIAPPDIARGISVIHTSVSGGLSSIPQMGGIVALDPEFEDRHLGKMVALLQKWRDYAVEKFNSIPGLSIIKPEGTNLLLPNISSFGMNSMEFALYLLREAGVACAPGSTYHAEGHVRVSLRTERNEEVIDRIAKAVSKLSNKHP